jgi:hypothetical protein
VSDYESEAPSKSRDMRLGGLAESDIPMTETLANLDRKESLSGPGH